MKNCPFCYGDARAYTNSNWRVGVYSQVRCKSKTCRARGPLVTRPRPYTSWAEDHALPSYTERAAASKAKLDAVKAEVKAEAVRAWNERML